MPDEIVQSEPIAAAPTAADYDRMLAEEDGVNAAPVEPIPDPIKEQPAKVEAAEPEAAADPIAEKLDALDAKIEAMKEIKEPPKEIVKTIRKAEALRAKIKDGTFDSINDGNEMLEALLEADDTNLANNARIARLEATIEAQAVENAWVKAERQYPNLERKAMEGIFENCVKDAVEVLGDDAPRKTVQKLADKFFADRASGQNTKAAPEKKVEQKINAPSPKPNSLKVTESKDGAGATIMKAPDYFNGTDQDYTEYMRLIQGLEAQ